MNSPQPRRLDPCPCGSGKRYKDCHGSLARPAPSAPPAGYDEALALRNAGDVDAALARVERALAQAGSSATLHNLRGLLCQDRMELDRAHAAFDAALALDPAYAEAHVNRGLLLLLEGDLARGFEEFAWRTRAAGYADYANFPFGMPRWKGEDLAGRSILVHAEQGQGDTLQFARFLAPLAQAGAAIDVFCHPPLATLMARMPGVRRAMSELRERPTQDYHAPILDIAQAHLSRPGAQRWLGARADALPERLAKFTDLDAAQRPRIGIAWKGSPRHANDRNRSLTRALAQRLVRGSGTFVNLQLDEAPLAATMVDATARIDDWDDTAAALARIDLLVTVDTAIAHLAGAMGRPVVLLLPFSPDWRWGTLGETTPWYPSMTLVRQPARGAWDTAIDAAIARYPR
jgi:tetratricopeptide (TPR) repeat protein